MFASPPPGSTMNRRLLPVIAGLCVLTALGCYGMVGGTTTTPQNALSAQQQKDGWKMLFDGTTTNGWRGYKSDSPGSGWKVIDGSLTRAADNAGDIITRDKYRNFDFVIDWRVAEGGNSGIMYRATEDNAYIWYSA